MRTCLDNARRSSTTPGGSFTSGWATSGAPANWPKQWAQDVRPVAGSVYRQITLTTPGAQAGHWHVTVTPAFETSARELTGQQLAKAGYRLAEVLKRILP